MEHTELVVDINDRLKNIFGVDTVTGDVIWRIVFSHDQFEKRLGTFDDITPAGIYLRTVTEVREVPKYRQWIDNKYILERLVVIPEQNTKDLPVAKLSYEVIWVFEDKDGNYLPPKWEAAKFIIDTVYAAQYRNHSLAKYVDEEDSQEASIVLRDKRVADITEQLWGEQSSLHGRTAAGDMIVVPRSFEKQEIQEN